jgi:hypothetical protein
VREQLARAPRIASSVVTLTECERALLRLAGSGPDGSRAGARALLLEASRHWTLLAINGSIRARTGQPFPIEPVRTLDALHLATLLELEVAVGPLRVLSTEARVVDNAKALGFTVAPS